MSARPTLRDCVLGVLGALAVLLLATLACAGLIAACGGPKA